MSTKKKNPHFSSKWKNGHPNPHKYNASPWSRTNVWTEAEARTPVLTSPIVLETAAPVSLSHSKTFQAQGKDFVLTSHILFKYFKHLKSFYLRAREKERECLIAQTLACSSSQEPRTQFRFLAGIQSLELSPLPTSHPSLP